MVVWIPEDTQPLRYRTCGCCYWFEPRTFRWKPNETPVSSTPKRARWFVAAVLFGPPSRCFNRTFRRRVVKIPSVSSPVHRSPCFRLSSIRAREFVRGPRRPAFCKCMKYRSCSRGVVDSSRLQEPSHLRHCNFCRICATQTADKKTVQRIVDFLPRAAVFREVNALGDVGFADLRRLLVFNTKRTCTDVKVVQEVHGEEMCALSPKYLRGRNSRSCLNASEWHRRTEMCESVFWTASVQVVRLTKFTMMKMQTRQDIVEI